MYPFALATTTKWSAMISSTSVAVHEAWKMPSSNSTRIQFISFTEQWEWKTCPCDKCTKCTLAEEIGQFVGIITTSFIIIQFFNKKYF